MLRLRHVLSVLVFVGTASVAGCDDDAGTSSPTTPPTTASPSTTAPEFELRGSPQFLNRLVPGRRPLAVVEATGTPGPVSYRATIDLAGASVEVVPASAEPGTAAEVWVDLPAVTADTAFTVQLSATRGTAVKNLTLSATATPGTDDLASTATDIAAVFLGQLSGTVGGLPATPDALVNGTPVAGLLVVTHYAWFTDEAEIGLAWHIMVAPDDWAELYLRPRTALAPTVAYRLSSWSTALAGGPVTITPIDPPAEVTR